MRIIDGVIQDYCSAGMVVSSDFVYNWEYKSEIPYEGDNVYDELADKRYGFTEPNITAMPDGSIFCLLRTTDGLGVGPMYWSKSTDNMITWSKPKYFDKLGVKPELLTLEKNLRTQERI